MTNETKDAIKRIQIVKGLPDTSLMTTETLNAPCCSSSSIVPHCIFGTTTCTALITASAGLHPCPDFLNLDTTS